MIYLSTLNILQYIKIESQGYQSIFSPEKEIDTQAREFIKNAYNIGIPVKLTTRFLQESNYACTIKIAQEELKAINFFPNNYNCSHDSGIGR